MSDSRIFKHPNSLINQTVGKCFMPRSYLTSYFELTDQFSAITKGKVTDSFDSRLINRSAWYVATATPAASKINQWHREKLYVMDFNILKFPLSPNFKILSLEIIRLEIHAINLDLKDIIDKTSQKSISYQQSR